MKWYHHAVRGGVQVLTIGLGIVAGVMIINYLSGGQAAPDTTQNTVVS